MKIIDILPVILFSIAVSACGGGGGSTGGGGATDSTPPTISSTSPAGNASNVATNTALAATFSEAMSAATFSATTFTLNDASAVAVTGTLDYSGTTATFTPASLSPNSTYTATITTGVKDAAGNALASNHTWTFITGTASDAIAPTVSSTSPANNAIGVGVNAAITATFSEPMLASAINSGTFTLSNGVTGTVTYSGTTATFTPSSNLAYSTSYAATINADSTRKDLAGNALAISYTWTFTTGSAPDTIAPTVSLTSPLNSDTDVAPNTAITATFSEPVSASTLNLSTFTLLNSAGSPIAGAVTYNGMTATFTPSGNLADSTNYTATITTGVRDLAGNALASNHIWLFMTGIIVDITAPTVVPPTSPVTDATSVAAQNPITATFSEALDASTVTTATFTLAKTATPTTLITGAVTYSGTTATFTPSVKLDYSTGYTATISTQVKDLAGNLLASSYSWPFTTRLTPVVNAVATGVAHTVALKDDGTLWSWGYNQSGQLGVGDLIDRYTPVQIGLDTDWAAIAAGDYHTIALKSDGTLWAWGDNQSGQLGDGTSGLGTEKNVPTLITNTTPSTPWTVIAGGNLHTLALKSDGTLWAWGNNFYGQLGNNAQGTNINAPIQIGSATWTAIAGGGRHSLAIKSGGTLWAWGDNDYGQLGDGTTTDQPAPKQIGPDADWGVVSAGNDHSLAIKTPIKTLWAWGGNYFGQLGDGTTTYKPDPTLIGSATDWQKIDGGYAHTVAIKTGNTLWTWGYNLNGQLGDGTTINKSSPAQIGADIDWSAVSAGDAHSVALKTNWVLYAWGANDSGQLGDGTYGPSAYKTTPVLITY